MSSEPLPALGAPRALSTRRRLLALAVAVLADSVGALPGEHLPLVFDLAVALVLAAITGFRPLLLPALLLKAIPVVGLFPTWVAAVLAIVLREGRGKDPQVVAGQDAPPPPRP